MKWIKNSIKKSHVIFLLLLSVGICGYLFQLKNPITEKIAAMYGMNIKLSLEQMLMTNVKETSDTCNSNASYKILVFYDSLSCSSCAYKHMFIWNDFISECKKVQSNVQFYFVLNPSKENQNDLFQALQIDYGFSEPLLIDTTGTFMKDNPNIPQEKLFHSMLLDSENKVILVGDPTSNQKLKALYVKAISN